MAIKKLEDELGMPLLQRSSIGTVLTENGQWLVKKYEEFINEIEYFRKFHDGMNATKQIVPQGEINIFVNEMGIGVSTVVSLLTMRAIRLLHCCLVTEISG